MVNDNQWSLVKSLPSLKPRRTFGVWWLQFNVELLQRVIQRRLIPRKIRSDRIVKQQQLLMHHFHLSPIHIDQSVNQLINRRINKSGNQSIETVFTA